MERIERDTVAEMFRIHGGHDIFTQSLARVSSREHLIQLLDLHINVLNAPFVGFSAILGGRIVLSRDAFVNPKQQATMAVADRATVVAERVIFAIIDEVGERSIRSHPSHRALAQATFLGIMAWLKIAPVMLNAFYESEVRKSAARMVEKIGAIYGVDQDRTEESLWGGLGAHLAGEYSAITEFAILDTWLRKQHIAPGMVEYLEKTVTNIEDRACPAYAWLPLHHHEEAEHTDAAFVAIENALTYWAGSCSRECALRYLWDGIEDFAATYAAFAKILLEL